MRTDLDSIPASVPYVTVAPEHAAKWRDRLPANKPLRIAVVWSGAREFAGDASRSIALARMKPVLADDRVAFVSLVREVREANAPALRGWPDLIDVSAELHDFRDTAAIISLVDLVISVDTSVAHLAGAMAKPVWVLLPFAPEWRWMLAREDSPWYPTARLFRQPAISDWDSVITRVRDEIGRMT